MSDPEHTHIQPPPEQLSPVETHHVSSESLQPLGHVGMGGMVQVEIGMPQSGETVSTVAETANYQGNWLLAQQDRMTDPDFKAKYDQMVTSSLPHLKEGEPGLFEKAEQFRDYHQDLARTFEERNEHVYSAVGYTEAKQHGLGPQQFGRSDIGEQGTVFSDAATADGVPLTARQKDIIAAHEAYHGMVKAPTATQAELSEAFDSKAYFEIVDTEGIKQPGYLRNPDELMARMAQLKNYFGMHDGAAFTKDHLDYARAHYVQDTDLDNSMSLMFRTVTPRTEVNFLRLMNSLPV